jgi:hypothetical protein
MLKTGSINLANTQIIPEEGFHPHNLDGKVTIEIWSTDISASKVCTLQVSLSKDRWFNAKENGEDIAATLETGGAGSIFLPVQVNPHGWWRISIATGATGTVNYIIHD